MKKDIKEWILTGVGVYAIVFLGLTTLIIMLAFDDKIEKELCIDKNVRRIEYIFPSRLIGCWLGEKK